jgi:hypothetical protein
MAAAIGQSVNIPAFLRSLACDMYQGERFTGLSYILSPDLLVSLDAGCDIDDDLSKLADNYNHDWWTLVKQPARNWEICSGNIVEAIDIHRALTKIKEMEPIKTDKTFYTWNRNVKFTPEGTKLDCNRCRLYRGVSLGILDNTQDLRHHVHGLEVAYEERADLAARRAAGFFSLYEAALMKETNLDDSRQRRRSKGKAKAIENHPSIKWTWGEDLTKEDVLKALESVAPIPQEIHSGYNTSLPWGRYGVESDAPLSPSLSKGEIVSEIDVEGQSVPHINDPDHYPVYPLDALSIQASSSGEEVESADKPSYLTRRTFHSWLQRPDPDYVPSPPPLIQGVNYNIENSLKDCSSAGTSDSIISTSQEVEDSNAGIDDADGSVQSDSTEGGRAGRILGGLLSGQVRYEHLNATNYVSSNIISVGEDEMAMAAAEALGDSDDSDGELGGRILAAILGGNFIQDDPLDTADNRSTGPRTDAFYESDMDFAVPSTPQRDEPSSDTDMDFPIPSTPHRADKSSESDIDFPIPSSPQHADPFTDSDMDFAVPSDNERSNPLRGLRGGDGLDLDFVIPLNEPAVMTSKKLSDNVSRCSADAAADAFREDDSPDTTRKAVSSDTRKNSELIPGPFNADFFSKRVQKDWIYNDEENSESEEDGESN